MSPNINNLLSQIPQFLSSRHLVQLGLYPSLDAVYLARARGQSPDFLKLKRKVLYPQDSVLLFIEQKMKKGNDAPAKNHSVAQQR